VTAARTLIEQVKIGSAWGLRQTERFRRGGLLFGVAPIILRRVSIPKNSTRRGKLYYRWCFSDLLIARDFVEEFGAKFCKPLPV
jgi:hypothetical protein